MPLPSGFDDWEHLQDQVRLAHNKEVRAYFADAADDDISTPRSSLKQACYLKDSDTGTATILRLWLFEFIIGRGRRIETAMFAAGGGEQPQLNYKILRKNKPMITLYFLEDGDNLEPGYDRVKGTISVRLMNQTTTTLTTTELGTYARKIKTLFGTGQGFIWKKGKIMCSYADWDKGYQLQLLCFSEAEGRRVVEQVLDIQGHSPEWEYFEIKQNAEPSTAYPVIPPQETILGKRRRLPRRRPVANVRYQYATLSVSGVGKPVVLHDRTYRFRDAVEK